MYCRIAAGYQIWESVNDLRIIFFICEHIHSVPNVLVTSVKLSCPQTFYRKIKLLEFSVKGLRMPGVINMYVICIVLTAPIDLLVASGIQTIGMGFTDYKDASRTIRTGFTDIMVFSHETREFTERRFLMVETLYKGQQAWVSPMALSAF